MDRNTPISLRTHFEEFVHRQIVSDGYASASEVIRAGLRLLEERERKIEALNQSLIVGEQSGIAENYNPEEHLKELQKQYSK